MTNMHLVFHVYLMLLHTFDTFILFVYLLKTTNIKYPVISTKFRIVEMNPSFSHTIIIIELSFRANMNFHMFYFMQTEIMQMLLPLERWYHQKEPRSSSLNGRKTLSNVCCSNKRLQQVSEESNWKDVTQRQSQRAATRAFTGLRYCRDIICISKANNISHH